MPFQLLFEEITVIIQEAAIVLTKETACTKTEERREYSENSKMVVITQLWLGHLRVLCIVQGKCICMCTLVDVCAPASTTMMLKWFKVKLKTYNRKCCEPSGLSFQDIPI